MQKPDHITATSRIANLSAKKRRLLANQIKDTARSGNDVISEQLLELGITHVYSITGFPIDKALASCAEKGIRIIGVRDQQTGGLMALAQNYASGKLCAAVMVSPGPAVTNLTTAILAAQANCWPLLVIGACAAFDLQGKGEFQELDGATLFKPLTKYSEMAQTAADIPQMLANAFSCAVTGRQGPVYLDVPANIFRASAPADIRPVAAIVPTPMLCDPEQIKHAADLMNGVKKPLIIIGKALRWCESNSALRRIIDTLEIPFITSPMGRGILPDSHELCFNLLRGQILEEAEVVLVLGARLDWTFRFGAELSPSVKVIHIDVEPSEIGRNVETAVGINADLKTALTALADQLITGQQARESLVDGQWVIELQAKRNDRQEKLNAIAAEVTSPLSPQRLITELRAVMPEDAVCILDGATIMAAGQQLLPTLHPVTRYTPGSNGTLGVGVPYAIGAKLAAPEKQVIAVCGDLAIGFSVMELETAVRYDVPIIVIVANNQGPFGLNKQYLFYPADYPDRVAGYMPKVRYDVMCEAMGGHGEFVEHPDQFEDAWRRSVAANKPACINVLVDPRARYPGRD